MSGETLFKASARLQLPERCDLAALKKDLEKIAADLLVDVSFAELNRQGNGATESAATSEVIDFRAMTPTLNFQLQSRRF